MIKVEKVDFSYNGLSVLSNITFTIPDGDFIGIIGPNGAGKSTLLKLLDRVLMPASGNIYLNDLPLNHYSRKKIAQTVGYVQQEFSTAFDFSAWEIVLMGRFPHQQIFGFDSDIDRDIARQSMEATECFYLANRNFFTLSGGERQRVVLASALAQEPMVLLLDEPTSALDLKHQVHLYEILKNLQSKRQMTIITVTHEINLAAQYCNRLLVIKNGSILADGSVNDVLKKRIVENVYETAIEIIKHPITGLPVILPKIKE